MVLRLILLLSGAAGAFGQSAEKKPFDVWALVRLVRLSDARLSPDGSTVAFVGARVSVAHNDIEKHIYTIPLAGGEAGRITYSGKSNTRPRWSPDSRQLAFISDRAGSSQIWLMDPMGENARQLTDSAGEADGVVFSPDGRQVIFTSRVYPDCGGDNACNQDRLRQQADDPVKAKDYDSLLYRHWDQWADGRRRHLFVLDLDTGEVGEEGGPRDLTPGKFDVPPFSLAGPDGYDVSPDGFEVCFTMNTKGSPATSTNSELYVVPIEGGEPVVITSNPAADTSPVYSPDGNYIAYRAQQRAGFESDRFRLMVFNRGTGEVNSLTEALDRSVTGIAWSPDSLQLFFTVEDRGREPIHTVPVEGGGIRVAVFGDARHSDVQLVPDGQSVVYSGHSGSHPVEIFRGHSSGGPPDQLTHLNERLLEEYEVTEFEEVTYESADGASISGFEVKPPGFSFENEYPLLVLIHGGPQGAWGESWSYRWNAQVFAGAGYVVFMPNPRGSTGYGQAFTDAVTGEWGGMVYEDILSGVDHILRRPYVDSNKVVAAGASYGGYMVNWILGHTDRFQAVVSHAGVYDLASFFGATEELWFPLWEFRGAPWENREMYEKWSPATFAKHFNTPTLVIHGQKDYRVPVTQGMQLFTALQLKEVPSRFLYYPDEGHWIMKPRNSIHWYQNVIDWLGQWVERPHRRRRRKEFRPTIPSQVEAEVTVTQP